jgi:hypothetical protein
MVHGLIPSMGKRLFSSRNQFCSPQGLLFNSYSMIFTTEPANFKVKNKWRSNTTPIIGFVLLSNV